MPMTKEAWAKRRLANRQQVMRTMKDTMKRAFQLDRMGIDQTRIARILNAEGHTTQTGLAWCQGTVCRLLNDYAGEDLD